MLTPAIRVLRRAVRRCRDVISPGALILLYHRIAEVDSDPWSLCVTPQHFAEHLDVLKHHAHPVRLHQMADAVGPKRRAPRPMAITFDDGYTDNLYHAKFQLERYDIPATVFVVSGSIGSANEFWWDELEWLLLQPGTLPESLCLALNGHRFQWHLGKSAYYGEEDYQRHHSWHIGDGIPTPRHSLYYSLCKLLRDIPVYQHRRVLDQLLAWSRLKAASRLTHRALSAAELLRLTSGGLIEIGSHTVTHSALSTLTVAAQREEIQQSKVCLEKVLGHPVRSLAYPHGDFTTDTVRLVREAGFARACSSIADSVRGSTDPFRLPRIEVHDCDGDEFVRRLSPWLSA
jgi:peptidoglycan/xylan/chitin deacetylase (PgdA/CDA1 family)